MQRLNKELNDKSKIITYQQKNIDWLKYRLESKEPQLKSDQEINQIQNDVTVKFDLILYNLIRELEDKSKLITIQKHELETLTKQYTDIISVIRKG